MKINKKKVMEVSAILVVITGILVMWLTQGKYLITDKKEYAKKMENFYFNSEVMEKQLYELNDWDGTSSYQINSIDIKQIEDDIRKANNDISYKVEVESENAEPKIKINDVETDEGILTGENIDNISLELTPIEPRKRNECNSKSKIKNSI